MPDKTCARCCKAGALRQCPCLLVHYCGRDCQVEHWSVHGVQCERARNGGSTTPVESCSSSAGLTDGEMRDTPHGVFTGSSTLSYGSGSTTPKPMASGMSAFSKRQMATEMLLTPAQISAVSANVERLARTSPATLAVCLVEMMQRVPAVRQIAASHMGLNAETLLAEQRTVTPVSAPVSAAPVNRALPSSSYYPMNMPVGVPIVGGAPSRQASAPTPARYSEMSRGGLGLSSGGYSPAAKSVPERETEKIASRMASQVLDCK